MSASGAGRCACATEAQSFDPEALPDPRETAQEALGAVAWLREPDVAAILAALDAAGLTICWRP